PDLVPDARQRGAQVWVVGQQWFARRGVRSADDPGVRSDAGTGEAEVTGHRTQCAAERVELRYDVPPHLVGNGDTRRGAGGRIETAVARGTAADDRAVPLERVGRVQLRDLLAGEAEREHRGPMDLFAHVVPQVPR